MTTAQPTSTHELIFNTVNNIHRDPKLSFDIANAVIDALSAADPHSVGFVVLAKRPDRHCGNGYDYTTAGSIHSIVEPCLNHQSYCTDMTKQRYPDDSVEYVIAELKLPVQS